MFFRRFWLQILVGILTGLQGTYVCHWGLTYKVTNFVLILGGWIYYEIPQLHHIHEIKKDTRQTFFHQWRQEGSFWDDILDISTVFIQFANVCMHLFMKSHHADFEKYSFTPTYEQEIVKNITKYVKNSTKLNTTNLFSNSSTLMP
jgi:hypothetical protein